MSGLDQMLKAFSGGPRPVELEFTRMLLDVRGCSREDIDRFFRKISKRPTNVGDPIEVRHTRQFAIIPGLIRDDDPYKSALKGAKKHQPNMGWIYDLSPVMLRTKMEWESIQSALKQADANFGFLLGIAADHVSNQGGQEVTVSLTIQPFRMLDISNPGSEERAG
jgi:hypothetical protein